MNVSERLEDSDILWADYAFISGMEIQMESTIDVLQRCKKLHVKTVGGGPLFSCDDDSNYNVDYLSKGEGELTVSNFLQDLKNGNPKHICSSEGWADLSQTPIPSWGLVDINECACLNVHFSRGCPFNCDFCTLLHFLDTPPAQKQRNGF